GRALPEWRTLRRHAAVPRRALAPDDGATPHAPMAAGAVAARRTVARCCRDVPARKARAIEERDLARCAGRARERESDEDQAAGRSGTSHGIAIVAPPSRGRTSFFDTDPAAGV